MCIDKIDSAVDIIIFLFLSAWVTPVTLLKLGMVTWLVLAKETLVKTKVLLLIQSVVCKSRLFSLLFSCLSEHWSLVLKCRCHSAFVSEWLQWWESPKTTTLPSQTQPHTYIGHVTWVENKPLLVLATEVHEFCYICITFSSLTNTSAFKMQLFLWVSISKATLCSWDTHTLHSLSFIFIATLHSDCCWGRNLVNWNFQIVPGLPG